MKKGLDVKEELKKQLKKLRVDVKSASREHSIRMLIDLTYLGSGWWEVVGDRSLLMGAGCEFGPAEEVIGILVFRNGTFEVGVVEILRPYFRKYLGKSFRKAWEEFRSLVCEHCAY